MLVARCCCQRILTGFSEQSESSRLLDDDLYNGGYGYGAVNQAHQNQTDPEDLKREREALEAICQRASE